MPIRDELKALRKAPAEAESGLLAFGETPKRNFIDVFKYW